MQTSEIETMISEPMISEPMISCATFLVCTYFLDVSTTAWARGCGTAVGVPGQSQGEDEADEGNGLRTQHVPGAGGSKRYARRATKLQEPILQ